MQPDSAQTQAASQVLLGCFLVGGRLVAIEVAHLREVVRFETPTPLPGAPGLVEGVIDLRGALVPVADLGRLLGGEPLRPGPRSRIAVAEVDGLAIGLAVDAAVEILAVDAAALGDPPRLLLESGCEATQALVRRVGGPPIAVLSLEHLIGVLHRSALRPRQEAA
jgi:purine-binding chemotaxis protein CheW